jgi:anti-sigma B factor antagonist
MPTTPGLDMTVAAETPEAIVLSVAGELDLATAKQFKTAVTDRLTAGRAVVLDLIGLAFCDSTGLGALAGLHRRAVTIGGDLRLAAVQPGVEHVLKLTGVSSVVPIFDDVPAALAG